MKPELKRSLRLLLPKAIRAQRILGGSLRGSRIITSWHDYPTAILGRTERPLLDWFATNVRPGETWLDIGAHYGYTAIALCRLVGESGRVFAFEPVISTAGYVAQTRLLNRFSQMIVMPLGLADSDGLDLLRLPVVRGMVDSTIQNGEWYETFLVASLDRLWPQVCGARECIDGVKIDVQGMELEVLRGMSDTLSNWKPRLVVEVHSGVDRGELLGFLEAAGYSRQATPIEPVQGEVEPQYVDDRSYVFQPSKVRLGPDRC